MSEKTIETYEAILAMLLVSWAFSQTSAAQVGLGRVADRYGDSGGPVGISRGP